MQTIQESIPLISCLPFIIFILLIAVMPLAFPKFWEKNRNKSIIAGIISLPVLVFMLQNFPGELCKTFQDYVSFILLLASLYVISGGILVTGDLKASPKVNTIFLLVGAVIANLIGTTGASMLLIRPLLKTISERKHITHIPIFFIFIVSNIGGSLTPLGDPPLFMGYLRGVPFAWTLSLFPMWLTTLAILLTVFYIWDSYCYRKENQSDLRQDNITTTPLGIKGKLNLFFLAGVVLAIFFHTPSPYLELIMVLMTILSLIFTSKDLRTQNKFTFNPISEVAILFVGIFITMAPLLLFLEEKGAALGITKPWQFFWFAGGLSSFLDNTPTYVTFTSLAEAVTRGLGQIGVHGIGVSADLLRAISCGAVFMGANTYIGNGPNFMVKSIAEEQGVKLPSFFGYMAYSGLILIPIFLLLTWIFFI